MPHRATVRYLLFWYLHTVSVESRARISRVLSETRNLDERTVNEVGAAFKFIGKKVGATFESVGVAERVK